MKKFVSTSALIACAILAFSASAHADQGNIVRASQTQLGRLGYFTGRQDGMMGPQTATAIRDFQAYNRLPVTGTLNAETFNLLMNADFRVYNGRAITQIAYTGAPAIAPVAYNYGYGYQTQLISTPTERTHVQYYTDNNGYEHAAASLTLPSGWTTQAVAAPVAYAPAYAPAPVAYQAPGIVQVGYSDGYWHY